VPFLPSLTGWAKVNLFLLCRGFTQTYLESGLHGTFCFINCCSFAICSLNIQENDKKTGVAPA
jgi:hypothetical protein